jgi:hypothetical protein
VITKVDLKGDTVAEEYLRKNSSEKPKEKFDERFDEFFGKTPE